MTKEYQIVAAEKSEGSHRKKNVSGINTTKPHRHDDSKGIVLDFIIMAVLVRQNDIIYK